MRNPLQNDDLEFWEDSLPGTISFAVLAFFAGLRTVFEAWKIAWKVRKDSTSEKSER
jgi:hypothetical protein